MNKFTRIVLALYMLIHMVTVAFAQTKPIKGKVLDEMGQGLPGVSVKVKSTNIGAKTNEKGEFEINVPPGATTFVISSVGYTTKELPIADNLSVSIEASSQDLEGVVVVGYGTQKKESVTGAVVQIDNKTLQSRPITNVAQGLQGAIGNLNISSPTGANGGGAPGSKMSINVRGYTGLGTSGGPLIVIDGIQGGDINALNPNDIESITLIKDAAAAAVYGSSAPYGVLLVTTKKGAKEGKPVINYSNNFTFAQPIGLPKMANSLDFANIINEAKRNNGEAPWVSDEAIQRIKDYQSGTLKDETIKDPNADAWLSWGGANANNDWFSVYFKDFTPSQQHNLSVSGGSKNSTYYIGLGYVNQMGSYRYGNDKYDKFNIRTNLTSNITDWLSFNFRGNFTKEITNRPNAYGGQTGDNYLHQIARTQPNIPLKNPDGEYSVPSSIPYMMGGRDIRTDDYPVLTGEFVAKLARGWNATLNYTYDGKISNRQLHTETLYGLNPSGSTYPLGWTAPNALTRWTENRQHQIINLFTDYTFNVEKHNFKVLGGFVNETDDFLSFFASNQQLFSDRIPSLSLSYGPTASVGDNITKLASMGAFGRFNYDFDGKYLFEFTGRYDGSSRFLSDVRWKFYPGVSAGWNIHKEAFWTDLGIDKVVNSFKLRASYASLGDQSLSGLPEGNIRIYPFYPNLPTNVPNSTQWFFTGGREASVFMPVLANPNLSWVTTNTLNLGFDATLLKDKMTLSFEWYRRSMDDFIGPPEVLPAVFGTTVPFNNSAALRTDGWELTLGWNDKIGDEFNYSLRGVLSDYVGTITRYPNPNGLLANYFAGQRQGDIWGYETDRYFTSAEDYAASPDQSVLFGKWGAGDIKYKDLNGDGKIDFGDNTLSNPGDRKVIGNSTPRYSYSLFTTAAWKNFDLSMFLQGVGKRDFFMGGNYFFGIVDNIWQSSVFTTHLDRWSETNPNGFFPKAYTGSEINKNITPQTKYLLNAAYLRMKNIQLGYNLPKSILDKIKVQKLRFYVSVDNLFTLSPMKKHAAIDPETTIDDAKIYPLMRNYSFGLNLTL